tara:strand:- start:1744 stop:2892 length:1149 start_codon:yes stop_codon:yes gene_type:complete
LPNILISCGEPSGDLYAGALTKELIALDPTARVYGLGGDHLEKNGADLVAHYEGLAATGISEALAVLPRSIEIYRSMVVRARTDRPDVFVAIDFPEINFRLAAAIRKLGIPVVYYIGPQAWAWRRGRFETMRRLVDLALVIFPFEEAIYQEAGIPVEFVGHPLVELSEPTESRESFLESQGLASKAPTVALLPGSRPNELRSILPGLTGAARLIQQRCPDVQFVVARAPHLQQELFESIFALQETGIPVRMVESRTDNVLAAADVVVTASGTATVQTAIHQRPMVIVYRLSAVTYWLVKTFSHVDNAGMVNLIAGKEIVPELLQERFTENAVATEVVRFLTDRQAALRASEMLAQVRQQLGSGGVSRRVGERVLAVADSNNA